MLFFTAFQYKIMRSSKQALRTARSRTLGFILGTDSDHSRNGRVCCNVHCPVSLDHRSLIVFCILSVAPRIGVDVSCVVLSHWITLSLQLRAPVKQAALLCVCVCVCLCVCVCVPEKHAAAPLETVSDCCCGW